MLGFAILVLVLYLLLKGFVALDYRLDRYRLVYKKYCVRGKYGWYKVKVRKRNFISWEDCHISLFRYPFLRIRLRQCYFNRFNEDPVEVIKHYIKEWENEVFEKKKEMQGYKSSRWDGKVYDDEVELNKD